MAKRRPFGQTARFSTQVRGGNWWIIVMGYGEAWFSFLELACLGRGDAIWCDELRQAAMDKRRTRKLEAKVIADMKKELQRIRKTDKLFVTFYQSIQDRYEKENGENVDEFCQTSPSPCQLRIHLGITNYRNPPNPLPVLCRSFPDWFLGGFPFFHDHFGFYKLVVVVAAIRKSLPTPSLRLCVLCVRSV